MEHLILVVILKIEALFHQFHFASKVETVISLYF